MSQSICRHCGASLFSGYHNSDRAREDCQELRASLDPKSMVRRIDNLEKALRNLTAMIESANTPRDA